MRLGALILTGGRSKRMGRPKEFLPFGGKTLLERTATTLRSCCDCVSVIRRDVDQELPPLPAEVQILVDEQTLAGPLAALASGLRWLRRHGDFADDDAVFVTGCDSPFLTADAVRWLAAQLGEHDIAMPALDGFRQPLCAVYRLRALAAADRLLAAGTMALRKMADAAPTRLLQDDELRAFDPSLCFLRNVNTTIEYEQACRDDRQP